eukprot:CAMPEP_0205953534 /NCGR_PEP_ID=MMETSP1459-20131121/18027_1 /ASSEMBLY_ACC=CAM_ASM_001120 /TAXON_ID=41880 /ORGANISM="Pycnococcus provasolii, Strain RCC931" /LENGTH=178 /DNA_ID=CAMNT_0053325653 /DNA_START=256 /DNA_END=792 /DNA_ORIENTATION=+
MGLHQSSDQVEYSESRERIWHCIRVVSIHGSLAILFHGLYDYFIMLRINERNHLPVQDWEYIARSDPFVYTLNGFTLLGLFLTVRMLSIGVTAVAAVEVDIVTYQANPVGSEITQGGGMSVDMTSDENLNIMSIAMLEMGKSQTASPEVTTWEENPVISGSSERHDTGTANTSSSPPH